MFDDIAVSADLGFTEFATTKNKNHTSSAAEGIYRTKTKTKFPTFQRRTVKRKPKIKMV